MPSLQAQAIYPWNIEGFYFYRQPGFSVFPINLDCTQQRGVPRSGPTPDHDSLHYQLQGGHK
jgi:hypothetical protein